MATGSCEVCGNPIPSHRRFCSKSCRYQAMFENCTCDTCGKTYLRNRLSRRTARYCSVECTPRNQCPLCKKVIVGRRVNRSQNKLRFCSSRCIILYYWSINGTTNHGAKGFASTLKRTGKIACERCGDDRLYVLCIHHKDRNRKNLSQDNLETVCANCHILEHHEGARKRERDAQTARLLVEYNVPLNDNSG